MAAHSGGGIFSNANALLINTIVCGNVPNQITGNWVDDGGNWVDDLCPVDEDTDGDGVPDDIDNCYLYNPDQADCNGNGIGDVCDIANQTSFDCDGNAVPDECQPDCDGDGIIDPCDILYGGETDYNDNDIPDNCELDCNENEYPDDWEIEVGLATDCNQNGVPDDCDLVNVGQIPEGAVQWTIEEGGNDHWYVAVEFDESTTESSMLAFAEGLGASLASISSLEEDVFVRSVASSVTSDTALLGGFESSNGVFIWLDGTPFNYMNWDDGQPDGNSTGEYIAYYDISNFDAWHDVTFTDGSVTHFIIEFSGTLPDCNSNGLLDSCEIADDPSLDCNGNGIPDDCDIVNASNEVLDQTKLISDDGLPGDEFGNSVSVDGNIVVIGAPSHYSSNQGNAYVFRFEGNEWIQEAKLTASDGSMGDTFGYTVCISGNVVIVGAYGDDDQGENAGAAYIYRYDGSTWIEEQKLLASDGGFIDYFGSSVSISGDTAIVGADNDDGANNSSWETGAAYIYRYDGSTWIEEQKLLASDGAGYDYFGQSVSISGDTAVVGACNDHSSSSNPGTVYIYRFNGSRWVEEEILTKGVHPNLDRFGESVCISDEIVIVGAHFESEDGKGSRSGSSYVYRFNGNEWLEEAKLVASDGENYHHFGNSLCISEENIIIGAWGDNYNGSATGSAYMFHFDGVEWVETGKLLASDGASDYNFGYGVGISGNVVAIGAYHDSPNGQYSGSAYMFNLVEGSSSIDCNENSVLDSCEIDDDPSLDCNENGTLDSCEDFDDCNYNEIPDSCDISNGTSNDVNMNGVPDECESDCNENGIPDDWEIKKGLVFDCNENMLPDECDIADGTSTDVNSNAIPDECEDDCNGNGLPDSWDIETGAALDCNNNGIPDSCDVAAGCDTDCNLNGIPDSCDIANGTSEDTNANNVPDECECIADITGDGVVNIHDLLALIGYWGSAGPLGDFNADGIVKIQDLLILIAGWGECTNIDCGGLPEGAVQWRVEDGGNGHWYGTVLVPDDVDCFDEIRLIALDLGGEMVIIQSEAENSFVIDLLDGTSDYLIGLIQNLSSPDYSEPGGGWEWVDGTPLDNSFWHSSEPNDTNGTQNFCGIYSGGWYDVYECDYGKPQSAVVEWSN